MAGEIDAVPLPAGRADAVEPHDAERHGQAAAALDDGDEVRVGQVVVGVVIAAVAVAGMDQGCQSTEAGLERTAVEHAAYAGGVAGELAEMGGGDVGLEPGGQRPAELERRVGEVDLAVRQLADRFQCHGGVDHRRAAPCAAESI